VLEIGDAQTDTVRGASEGLAFSISHNRDSRPQVRPASEARSLNERLAAPPLSELKSKP
jgi:hypothetical protein